MATSVMVAMRFSMPPFAVAIAVSKLAIVTCGHGGRGRICSMVHARVDRNASEVAGAARISSA